MKTTAKSDPTKAQTAARDAAALDRVAQMDDPDKLRNLMANAERMGVTKVRDAAFRRLAYVQPEADPDSVEHDIWQSIHALEQMLLEERGKTVRLTRTRQKIKRDGEIATAAALTLKTTPSDGFTDLIERGHPQLTFEAVTLRHPGTFDDATRDAARARLEGAGIDPASLAA